MRKIRDWLQAVVQCIDDDNVCYELEMNATLHFFDDVPGKIFLMT